MIKTIVKQYHTKINNCFYALIYSANIITNIYNKVSKQKHFNSGFYATII